MVRGSWVGVNLSLSQCRPVLHCADPSRGCYVSASQALAPCTLEATTIRKLQTHIIPFVFVLFMIAFVDRINIGFAALTMNKELAVTSQQFGLVAGIFFLGYFVFEIPSNLLMHRIGARIWIARILISWGRTQVQQFRHLPMWDKNCADGAETRQCL